MTTQSFWQLIRQYKIVVPIIQRDYAQGRNTEKVREIRERFLNALTSSLHEDSDRLELDFVYGFTNSEDNSVFVPLDGQQRLTTLFLTHWLVAVKEGHLDGAKDILVKFSYEIRHSSRLFCEQLVQFQPTEDDLEVAISKVITDQPWFFTAWKNDPTIFAMLIMLDDLQLALKSHKNVWPLLTSETPKIVFHLLPMDNLGLPDDLYIKMNSRGKQLTEFEYFKSRFSEVLNPEHASLFNNKIDQEWSDLFWNLYSHENSNKRDIAMYVDNGFLRFLRYISDLLNFQNENPTTHKDDFEYYKMVYSKPENVDFLFASLDRMFEISKSNPSYFQNIFYTNSYEYSIEKVRLFFNDPKSDLFKKCADRYENIPERVNPFSIGEQLLLYACLKHLIHNSSDFNIKIRVLRNLIANSSFEIRREIMPELLKIVSEFIIDGDYSKLRGFNSRQIEEEQSKWLIKQQNSSLMDNIHKLEDHVLLQGCISILNIDTHFSQLSNKFIDVFKLGFKHDDISRALLTFDNYSQKHRNGNSRFGTANHYVWKELFTPSTQRSNYNGTKRALSQMLEYLVEDPSRGVIDIVNNYLASYNEAPGKPKPWEYYFIKYPLFRNFEEGFYYWSDFENSPYECTKFRKSHRNGFHWSPCLQVINDSTKSTYFVDEYGKPLSLHIDEAILKIHNQNSGFLIEAFSNESSNLLFERVVESGLIDNNHLFKIQQNEVGIDIEDRIVKGIELVNTILQM